VDQNAQHSVTVAEALPDLQKHLGGAEWAPVIVVTEANPGSELNFSPPPGVRVVFDPERDWYRELGLFVFPAAGLFDPQGVLRWQRSGFSRDWLDVTEDSLRHYLGLAPREGARTDAPTLNREAERLYHLGISFAKDRRLDDALSAFDSALAAQPDFAQARFERAELLQTLGRDVEAESEFSRALESDSTLYRAWTGLGRSALAQDKLDAAMHAAERALQLNPRSFDAAELKARVLIHQKQYDEAEAILQQLVRLKTDNPAMRYYLGIIFEETGRPELALEAYREALRLLIDHSSP